LLELTQGIELFNDINIFPKNYIDNIKERDWGLERPNNENGRNTDSILLNNFNLLNYLKDFENNLNPYLDKYLKKYNTIFLTKEVPILLRYGSGQKFNNHIDDHPELNRRRISLIYYINDGYTGGNIEFPRFGINIKPKAGDLLIFPSAYTYNHIVHPVIDGTRYCIVQWYC